VTQVDEVLHTRVPRRFDQVACAFDIGDTQVGIATLRFGARQVDDRVHTVERGAQAARIRQADHGHFHRYALGQERGAPRRADQHPHRVPRLEKLPNQGPSDKSRGACDQNHAEDYSRWERAGRRSLPPSIFIVELKWKSVLPMLQ